VDVVAGKFIHAPQEVGRGQMNDMAPLGCWLDAAF